MKVLTYQSPSTANLATDGEVLYEEVDSPSDVDAKVAAALATAEAFATAAVAAALATLATDTAMWSLGCLVNSQTVPNVGFCGISGSTFATPGAGATTFAYPAKRLIGVVFVKCSTNFIATESVVWELYKNGVGTGITLTFAFGDTTLTPILVSQTIDLAANDVLTMHFATSVAASGTLTHTAQATAVLLFSPFHP